MDTPTISAASLTVYSFTSVIGGQSYFILRRAQDKMLVTQAFYKFLIAMITVSIGVKGCQQGDY